MLCAKEISAAIDRLHPPLQAAMMAEHFHGVSGTAEREGR